MSYTLPELPYGYGDLAPVISEEIMRLHHQKHHAAYVNNLNDALGKLQKAVESNDISQITTLLKAINFNAGGHINHSLFWQTLMPISQGGGILHSGSLQQAIIREFGSLDTLKEQLSSKAVAHQGSGWAWLGYSKDRQRMVLMATDNQDSLISKGLVPLFGIDVWEHAYYLQYKNVRAEYVKGIWSIVNWKYVESLYQKAQS